MAERGEKQAVAAKLGFGGYREGIVTSYRRDRGEGWDV
jgi:hypothetical protein